MARSIIASRAAVLLALVALAGCKEKKAAPPPAAASTLADRVLAATELSIRAAGGVPGMRFRGTQVYAQAMAQHMAVCGLVAPFADDQELFVPFVSIVTVPLNPDDPSPQYQFENHVGSTTAEASHVYVALVEYCYDKGGPAAGPYRSVRSTPPLPDTLPDLTPKGRAAQAQARPAPSAAGGLLLQQPPAGAATPPAPQAAPDQVAASGSVTMRQNGNLHADPHGPSLRVVPQGTPMHVFAQAPGGWYQVGDTAPWGWIHESMLDRH